MSGIEAAGFVLAAFPLLITALEDYRQGWEILEDWWKIKREYKKCQQNIKLQKLVFEENLEQLLSTLVYDEDELKLLIADPGGDKWRDAELEHGLKERLPRSYEVYLETIGEIKSIMESLKRALGVDVTGFQGKLACEEIVSISDTSVYSTKSLRVKFDVKPNFEFQKQRIKFTFNKKPRNQLLDELASYNTKLQKLLESSDRLAVSRQQRGKRTRLASAKMTSFWQHAKTVYGLLQRAWQCDCLGFHHANLLLQHRTTPEVELNVFFLFSWDAKQREAAPWKCRKTKIREVTDEVSNTIPVPTYPTPLMPSKTTNSLGLRPSLKNTFTGSKKGVKWKTSELPSETVEKPVQNASTDITDLCSTIASMQSSCSQLGCLRDTDHQYHIYPLPEEEGPLSSAIETITLETLVSKASPIRLSRRQRYAIALKLASSHLQLRDSPWLEPQWSKKDILFYTQNGNIILTEHPYISKSFLSETAPTPQSSAYVLADHGMSALGILLLELCFGMPLEDHEIRRNFVSLDGQPNPGLDLVAAMQWCDRYANDEAGPEFAGAIDWCLRNPTARTIGAKEQEWREELFTQVVEPLQYCHKQLVAAVGER